MTHPSLPHPKAAQYRAQLTPYVALCCIMAGSAGLMYGYDLVVAGGISVMDDFLKKFFPHLLANKKDAQQDKYCRYRDTVLQLFSSCLYLAATLGTFVAASITRRFGRTGSMRVAGLLFLSGTVLGTAAQNLAMLLLGRTLLGCGLRFSNQAVLIYVAEIAPPRSRGGLQYIYGINVCLGALCGNVVNYLALRIHPWGWRLSLGAAGIPAILLAVFSLILVESPTSLIQRGHYDQAKEVLRKIRHSDEVEGEFCDLLAASAISERAHSTVAFRALLDRRNIPSLVVGIALPFFQQLSGSDAIAFYGAFLFKLAGFGDGAALYSTIFIGATSLLTLCGTLFVVDRVGRRKLLFAGGALMVSSMVIIGSIFATTGYTQDLPRTEGLVEVVMMCLFIFGFFTSLGPLAWLIPSEIFSLEVRPAGLSVTVSVNMLFKFVIAQTFLSMLCAFKYGIFLFFSGWVIIMAVFVALFVPETKGIPVDAMQQLWPKHWFWKRVVPEEKNRTINANTVADLDNL